MSDEPGSPKRADERYEVEIADEEVLPENLDSIANITRFVGEKTTGTNGAG